jgi:predicted lipid-binding transport protein (Tim44 family)
MTDPAIGLGQIVAADPSFDLVAFLNHADATMTAVKRAVQEQELVDVVELVSADIYDTLRTEVEGMLDRGGASHYDEWLSISRATVVAAEHSAAGDQITVGFQADASQDEVGSVEDPDETGAIFSEYWTFSRPPVSSQPPSRPECPTCGAPVDIDTGRICRYCRTLLPPPQLKAGWTVVAITPAAQNA